jgi:hypothetical protein
MPYFDQYTGASPATQRKRPIGSYAAFGSAPRSMGAVMPHSSGGGHFDELSGQAPLSPLAHQFREAMTAPTPAGQYAAGLQHAANYHYGDGSYQGGLMTNYGAGGGMRNLDRTYMPNRTVGGRFGLGPHAPPGPDNPYGYHPQPQMRPGWMDLMAMSQFGGARPGMVGGNPAWVDGPEREANAGHLPASRYVGGVQGVGNLTAMSEGMPGYSAMQKAAEMLNSPARKSYLNQRAAVVGSRQANVAARGIQRGQARSDSLRMRRGQLSMPEQMAFNIPGFANQMLDNQNSQGWMNTQAQMFAAKMQAEQQQQHLGHLAGLAGSIPGMNLPPGLQQQYMNHIMQQFGMPGAPNGGHPTGSGAARANYYLTPQQQGEFAGLKTRGEKIAWLNKNGVMDHETRVHLLGPADAPRQGLGGLTDWAWGYSPHQYFGNMLYNWMNPPTRPAQRKPKPGSAPAPGAATGGTPAGPLVQPPLQGSQDFGRGR